MKISDIRSQVLDLEINSLSTSHRGNNRLIVMMDLLNNFK